MCLDQAPSSALPCLAMMILWGEIEVDGTDRLPLPFRGRFVGVRGTLRLRDVEKALMAKLGLDVLMTPRVSAEITDHQLFRIRSEVKNTGS